jgi:hypothetical protein
LFSRLQRALFVTMLQMFCNSRVPAILKHTDQRKMEARGMDERRGRVRGREQEWKKKISSACGKIKKPIP